MVSTRICLQNKYLFLDYNCHQIISFNKKEYYGLGPEFFSIFCTWSMLKQVFFYVWDTDLPIKALRDNIQTTDPPLNKITFLKIFKKEIPQKRKKDSLNLLFYALCVRHAHDVEECVWLDRPTCHLFVQNISCRLVIF